jgi:phage shock protein PspC (stress-responsive transcriptional regulator)
MIYRYGLFRDPARGWIAGVAAGLADRFGVTALAVRLSFLLLALCGRPVLAVAIYALLGVVVPARPLTIDARSDHNRR